ncbi:MAG: 16S rRNA processing protein RimM [Sphingobacteriales bacterium]|nr:MAG: 16S rRNA processing protein RimM [Sphingobacteriales bacterium]
MIRIGKIVATHGLQGSLILSHIIGESDWLKTDDTLFIELRKGSHIPYFVTQAKGNNHEEYILQVEDVTTVEEAKKLIGKTVYVNEDILSKHADDSPLLWIGFNLVDKTRGGLGTIEDVMQAGAQWLARITYEGKEVLIPLVDQMILDVNIRNKYLRMDLPEGLIDVYLDK